MTDSRSVNALLKPILWNRLRDEGFAERAGRTAWRRNRHSIDVVNIQSFNSYLAERMGATTYSFAVNLGVAYPTRNAYPWSFSGASDRPKEFQCPARKVVTKGMRQQVIAPRRMWHTADPLTDAVELRDMDRPDVWFVRPDGDDLRALVEDASHQIQEQGFPWFSELADLDAALGIFERRPETMLQPGIIGEVYGGRLGSMSRTSTIASISMEREDPVHARRAIEEMRAKAQRSDQPWNSEYVDRVTEWLRWLDEHEDG